MANDTFKLVQGDTGPLITLTLTKADVGTAFDLSAASTTVSVKFRAVGSTTVLSTISCTKTDAVNGVVTFDFSGGVLDSLDAGLYEGEVIIDFGGSEHTAYDVLKFRLRDDF